MSEDPDPPNTAITILLEDPAWRRDLAEFEALVQSAARAALQEVPAAKVPTGPSELTLILADEARVRALNRDYRGADKATNLLSFAYLESSAGSGPPVISPDIPSALGDVVIAREIVVDEATSQGKPLAHHLSHLVVHGILHLLGYDHQGEGEAAQMEALEVTILANLGIGDPYLPRSEEPLIAPGAGAPSSERCSTVRR